MRARTRRQLLAAGYERSAIDRFRRREVHRLLVRGIYVLDDAWESTLHAHVLRGGHGSAVSHRAAARLHGFDGFGDDAHVAVTVPSTSSFRSHPAVRSTTLRPEDVVRLRGLPVTAKARTLLDLGRVCTDDEVELALHSALRGEDRRRPDLWNEALHGELRRLAASTRAPGSAALRTVLARFAIARRPTGSLAETKLLQAFRHNGFESLLCQPTVTVVDPLLGRRFTVYPDLLDIDSGVVHEPDGEVAHGLPAQRRRDAHRDNMLGDYLRVRRVPAADILRDADAIARDGIALMSVRRSQLWLPSHLEMTVDDATVTIRRVGTTRRRAS